MLVGLCGCWGVLKKVEEHEKFRKENNIIFSRWNT